MMIVTLTGPMASGKTLMREWIEQHIGTVEAKTGHRIFVREVLDDNSALHAVHALHAVPAFRVMRFKASGKWMDTFNITASQATHMQHVAELLRKAKNMPKGGSMVVVEPLTESADAIFYPIEVKDGQTNSQTNNLR